MSLRVTLGSEPCDPTLSIHPIVNFCLACETHNFSGFCALRLPTIFETRPNRKLESPESLMIL
ncbi:hypothetical protein ABIF66_000174 [Bradyrhizobium japonicum]